MPCIIIIPQALGWQKLPKWDPYTRQGQYIGKPSTNANFVGLIRNLRSGYIFL